MIYVLSEIKVSVQVLHKRYKNVHKNCI